MVQEQTKATKERSLPLKGETEGAITLEEVKALVSKFSDDHFGKDRPFTSPLLFLQMEVKALKKSGEMEDFVDCLILLIDAFRKRFPDVPAQKLIDFCKEKIEVIIPARSWKKINHFNYDNH